LPTPTKKLPARVPLLPLRSTAVYPVGVIGVQIGMPSTLEMLAARNDPALIVAVVIAPGDPDDPIDPRSLEKIGVLARVSDRLNMPGGTIQATVQGLQRIRISEVIEEDGYYTGLAEAVEESLADEEQAQELIARVLNSLEILAHEIERVPREVPRILRMNIASPGRFADLVATLANFSVGAKDAVVQHLDVLERLQYALTDIEQQVAKLRAAAAAADAAAEATAAQAPAEPVQPATPSTPLTRAQHATELRQRIKMLQSELGDVDPVEREVLDYLRRIEAAEIPARIAAQTRTEIERLRSISAGSLEGSEIRTYVDWLLHMPWRQRATAGSQAIDLQRVKKALDDALLGLTEQKNRVLDYLAVAKLRGDLRGPIPCIVGPPEVGKRAFVEAIAAGLGRPLSRLDLGGRGEAQIIGQRRTRAGAAPGKIVGALRDVGVGDPILLLSQMDEIGLGKVEGDPIEALEEVLDWDNRTAFIDRYLDVPFDLGSVLFIATAHDFFRIPRDLRELMVEIRIAGYTAEEKAAIARARLLPRLISEHGIARSDVEFPRESLAYLTHGYARDAGLGMLRRALQALLRTRARAKADGDERRWRFTPDRIVEILGLPRFTATPAESSPEIGVVTGLAWTAAGGELMFIEALRMPGSGRLIITGMLGDVMRESVNAAYSYVRSRGDALGIDDTSFRESDIHVHFPVGAIPKDGPSAGVAVTLAVASTLSNRPVRHDIAMTGEVTLRGKVLEIGGVKEKVLAAYRAGIVEVILPSGNERDLRDVPDDVRANITFHCVQRRDDVLAIALFEHHEAETKAAQRPLKSTRKTRPAGHATATKAARKK
jgi:ATP-dependent Lon protease